MLEFSDKDFKTSIMKYSTEQGTALLNGKRKCWQGNQKNKIQMTILELKHIIAEILKPG